ncbi:MAG: hypothetical protein JRD89_18020 [Deltaproteobacteria bacterium]|nr:hypothetical protein [Deltaproteobacteria bacterium]
MGMVDSIALILARLPLERWLSPRRDPMERWDRLERVLEAAKTSNLPPLESPRPQPRPPATGTGCLSCSRDHFSAASSMLSEGLRFARENGLKDPEAVRRIGLALDELNAMERIDLAPQEIVGLTGEDRHLAEWALKRSRLLRHKITAMQSVEDMEEVAALAGDIRDEFLSRLMGVSPKSHEECESCPPLLDLKAFLEERRKREGG